jgi:hypothetical protein
MSPSTSCGHSAARGHAAALANGRNVPSGIHCRVIIDNKYKRFSLRFDASFISRQNSKGYSISLIVPALPATGNSIGKMIWIFAPDFPSDVTDS